MVSKYKKLQDSFCIFLCLVLDTVFKMSLLGMAYLSYVLVLYCFVVLLFCSKFVVMALRPQANYMNVTQQLHNK